MKPTVAILGGGVAGLSAAHELCERGFQVSVYERKSLFGGKARSLSVPGTGIGGKMDLPAEHGFRFFPGFYQHLPDTMRRTPFGSGRGFDNLVGPHRILKPHAGGWAELISASHLPESLEDMEVVSRFLFDWAGSVGIPPAEH